jgi:hypothetical protein
VNRYFGVTLLALVLLAEAFLRWTPHGPPALFRTLYGNSLSMYMRVAEQLEERAPGIRVLGLGDSLAMTQFDPATFAEDFGYAPGEVFNAAYLGMSFPSQEDLLRTAGLDRFDELELVLFFVNPRRLSSHEETNTEVFRVGVPAPDGPWRQAWQEGRVGPILDRSRLYGLSRYLMLQAPANLTRAPSWDRIEYLQPLGGVSWSEGRADPAPPEYPFPTLEHVSSARLAEMRRVIELLRDAGVAVTIVPSAVHPAVDPFASDEARAEFDAAVASLASETGARHARGVGPSFDARVDTDFCDYGHTNDRGGEAYTRNLLRFRDEIVEGG